MYYLIEHNRTTKETVYNEYEHYIDAQSACLQKEQLFFTDQKYAMEVVVFEANTLDDLKRTHSRYFVNEQNKEESNATGALMAVGLVGLAVYLLSKK